MGGTEPSSEPSLGVVKASSDLIDFGEEQKPSEPVFQGNDLLAMSDNEEALDDEDGGEFGPIEPGQKRIILKFNEMNFPINWFCGRALRM